MVAKLCFVADNAQVQPPHKLQMLKRSGTWECMVQLFQTDLLYERKRLGTCEAQLANPMTRKQRALSFLNT